MLRLCLDAEMPLKAKSPGRRRFGDKFALGKPAVLCLGDGSRHSGMVLDTTTPRRFAASNGARSSALPSGGMEAVSVAPKRERCCPGSSVGQV